MRKDPKRIAVIGFGAMARSLSASLAVSGAYKIAAALLPTEHDTAGIEDIAIFNSPEELVAWGPSLVVECASHEAVSSAVPVILRGSVDVVLVSVGSLADELLLARLETAALEGGSKLVVASGAIGGLDVLRSAKIAGLRNVVYTGTKPPAAWKNTPADREFNLEELGSRTVIFKGSAAEASTLYPKNANVTAAVALAGVGFADTEVTLVADPQAHSNSHEITAEGAFGRFTINLQNQPLPENPKTSWLAALSIEQAISRHFQTIEL